MRVYLEDIDLAIDVRVVNGSPAIELFIRCGTQAILGKITADEAERVGDLFGGAAETARIDTGKAGGGGLLGGRR